MRRRREPKLESASSGRAWPVFPESKTPVTVTRHGETLGVFVPVGALSTLLPARRPRKADIEAVRLAGEEVDAMIKAAGTSAEELIADFEELRREKRASRYQR